ncbi:MAG: hypothetical protein NXH83_09695 [Rhodobacteraceae bacterium]|nr:hypothetical protein [Paracoccaceae bacterium]
MGIDIMEQSFGGLIDATISWIGAEEWRIGLALLLVVSLVGSLIASIIGRRRSGGRGRCKWHRVGQDANFAKWTCQTCGADAYVSKARNGKGCNRAFRGV